MAMATRWDPVQYERFARERARPFFDLLAQVELTPASVADLGCGPGSLTATLCERWPAAQVVGIDSSAEMLEAAEPLAVPGRLAFRLGDLREWHPDAPVDLIVSNAALQWVAGHREVLGRLATFLAPGGVLAFQVPGNFNEASHTLLEELRASRRWRNRLGERPASLARVFQPVDYLADLAAAGLEARVWETTYLQVLEGADPVLEWLKGTALRPVLGQLSEEEGAAFCAELRPLLAAAYPQQDFGTVLPFRRIFAVGFRPS